MHYRRHSHLPSAFVHVLLLAALMGGCLLIPASVGWAAPPAPPIVPPAEAETVTPRRGLVPPAGRLIVIGTVTRVQEREGRFELSVTRITTPDGRTTPLSAPRKKVVMVPPSMRKRLHADIRVGAALLVMGSDAGPGGSLNARLVAPASAGGVPMDSAIAGLASLLPPVTDPKRVTYEQVAPARGSAVVEGGARRVQIESTTGNPFGARLCYGLVSLENGRRYRLSLSARADTHRLYDFASYVYLPGDTNNEDKHSSGGTAGLEFQFWVTPEWRTFETTFTARNMVPGSRALVYTNVGYDPGSFWIKDVVLTPLDAAGVGTPRGGEPVNTASTTALVVPRTMNTMNTVNSVATVIDDMSREGDAMPHGAQMHGWALRPCVNWGRSAPPPGYRFVGPWGQLYEAAEGSRGWNVRVEFRDLEEYVLSRRDGKWRLIVKSTLVEGDAFREDFFRNQGKPANTRREPGGTLSAKAGSGYNFHFWAPQDVLPEIDPADLGGVFVTVQARLIPEDPSVPDHFALSRYLLSVGADYDDGKLTGPADDRGVGMGRFKFVTPQWQAFNFTNLSPEEIRANPPPLR